MWQNEAVGLGSVPLVAKVHAAEFYLYCAMETPATSLSLASVEKISLARRERTGKDFDSGYLFKVQP